MVRGGGGILLRLFFIFLIQVILRARAYTIGPSESIIDGQTLISKGGTFELGFFTPPNSNNRYLGIWYKRIPLQTIVWVANRDSPLNDTSGLLKLSSSNTVILNSAQTLFWSSNSSKSVRNPILDFLDSGNLVLRDETSSDSQAYLWQSFDYPGDTLLPGMKLGWTVNTGFDRYLTAWKALVDPSPGDFTYGMERTSYLESAIRNGSHKLYRGGPWNGVSHSGAPDLRHNPIFTFELVHNVDETYYMYQLVNQSVVMKFMLTPTPTGAQLQRLTWVDKTNAWVLLVSIPRDRCDDYALCGIYSTCDVTNVAVCRCLEGFKPKSPDDWSGTDWSQGCERDISVNCSSGEGFRKYTGLKLPDTKASWVNASMNLKECKISCLNNCSCMAYSNSDIRGGGTGCIMWFGDLIDIRQLSNAGEDLYVRMAASELVSKEKTRTKKLVIVIVCIMCTAGLILLGTGSWCFWKKRSHKGGNQRDDLELPIYDLVTITTATDNFSKENLLGEGGFGPVYKGKFGGEQEIAVKRLSKDSTQGVNEFTNEVILFSKLQHRNLVRLIGCCIQGEEKMLIYEYLPNKSLDSFIFDASNGRLLDWQKRFEIILGIARGLVYLHHDSRLRIIHIDLKVSNILLDSEMVPKIADFGMARIFGEDQTDAKTKRVVGTYGYMAPEYAIDGLFSIKSDVFSFGVVALEIISGKKNRSFCHPGHDLNLLGHAWKLFNEDKLVEMVDESVRDSGNIDDVLRCIHIGLLCVQRRAEERPTMSSVVLMLSSQGIGLPNPQQPGFYHERSSSIEDPTSSAEMTMTMFEAR